MDLWLMSGEVSRINNDGILTVWLHDYAVPVTTRGGHLDLVAKKKGKLNSPRGG
jgi:hypothetical protein